MVNIPSYPDEAAFPRPPSPRVTDPSSILIPEQWGLTKREVFAAMAMQGMAMRVTSLPDREVARGAVTLADALIAELEKRR